MTVADLSERELIARIQQRLLPRPEWLLVPIGDDAAVVEPARNRVDVLTVDAIVDGIHFDRAVVPPDAIGHRALAVNLSDLAAMGAAPRLALLSMMLPPDLPVADFDGIAAGCAALAARHTVHIVGGNLTRTSGPLTIDVTAIGTVKRRQALTRAGARAGDEVYVSGTIGAAADRGSRAYLYPEPRVRLGVLLARNRAATACMDLSDGLADAAHQIACASGVGMTLDAAAMPVHGDVIAAIAAGDDYELLFTTRPRWRNRLRAAIRHAGVSLTRIGVCTERREVLLSRDGDLEPMPSGYAHFGRSDGLRET